MFAHKARLKMFVRLETHFDVTVQLQVVVVFRNGTLDCITKLSVSNLVPIIQRQQFIQCWQQLRVSNSVSAVQRQQFQRASYKYMFTQHL